MLDFSVILNELLRSDVNISHSLCLQTLAKKHSIKHRVNAQIINSLNKTLKTLEKIQIHAQMLSDHQ